MGRKPRQNKPSVQARQVEAEKSSSAFSDPLIDAAALQRELRSGRTARRTRGRPAKPKAPSGKAVQRKGAVKKTTAKTTAKQGTAAQQFLRAEKNRRRRTPKDAARVSADSNSAIRTAAGKVWTVSLTIVIPGGDIPLQLYEATAAYIKQQTRAGSVSVERGGAFEHLHIQGVYKKRSTSTRALKQQLHAHLQEHVSNFQQLGVSICIKQATNKGLHTWEGLVAYSRKYQGREDFKTTLHNVTAIEIAEGEKLLLLHGQALKHSVAITQCNIMERAATFLSYELRDRFTVSLAALVFAMCACGQFYLDPEWVVPFEEGSGSVVYTKGCILRLSCSIGLACDIDAAQTRSTNPCSLIAAHACAYPDSMTRKKPAIWQHQQQPAGSA